MDACKNKKRGRQTIRLVRILVAFQRDQLQSLEALSKLTGYSTRTIRRDLEVFEHEGICIRSKVDGKLFWKLRDTLSHTVISGS
jgi:predicted DNA-binding transcriptional regulator YafY